MRGLERVVARRVHHQARVVVQRAVLVAHAWQLLADVDVERRRHDAVRVDAPEPPEVLLGVLVRLKRFVGQLDLRRAGEVGLRG